MTSSNHSPPSGKSGAPRGYDHLLDPIPQPLVRERDTDTAWSEFDSLMNEELIQQDLAPPSDFEETQPFDRDTLK